LDQFFGGAVVDLRGCRRFGFDRRNEAARFTGLSVSTSTMSPPAVLKAEILAYPAREQ